jgi:hypothetical protein
LFLRAGAELEPAPHELREAQPLGARAHRGPDKTGFLGRLTTASLTSIKVGAPLGARSPPQPSRAAPPGLRCRPGAAKLGLPPGVGQASSGTAIRRPRCLLSSRIASATRWCLSRRCALAPSRSCPTVRPSAAPRGRTGPTESRQSRCAFSAPTVAAAQRLRRRCNGKRCPVDWKRGRP